MGRHEGAHARARRNVSHDYHGAQSWIAAPKMGDWSVRTGGWDFLSGLERPFPVQPDWTR